MQNKAREKKGREEEGRGDERRTTEGRKAMIFRGWKTGGKGKGIEEKTRSKKLKAI